MKSSRIAVLILAVAAVVAVAALSKGSGGADDKSGGGEAPKGAVTVTFHYSPEKEVLLKPLIERFNEEGVQSAGKPVFVAGTPSSSGEDEAKLAAKKLELVAWSPASSLWGRLLNYEADAAWAPDSNPSIVRTPLVVAMWEPMARELGWPEKQIGFDEILRLAHDERGWAAYGRPEFGPFKLVHTNPDFSTSGLSAVAAEYYSATGKNEGLTIADVTNPAVRAKVKAIERSIVHYGDTTLFIADQMRKEGPGYASAVAMEEATLLDFNKNRNGQPKLVPLFPPAGTFYSDSPFIILDAPWVSEEQKAAAHVFQQWLTHEVTTEAVAKAGFRMPSSTDDAVRELGLPEPKVLAKIKETWRADRKPANVLLVVDVSGSMIEERKIDNAKDGLTGFLREVAPQDRVGLMTFSTDINPLIDIGPIRENLQQLRQTVTGLIADGETSLFDATAQAVEQVRAIKDDSRINAVVVLTDGVDTNSGRSADDIVSELQSGSEGSNRIRVFTIAYGSGATGSQEILKRIAAASGGKDYTGSVADIESVYRSISSFF
jgi:Ca-activated chloride channel family protein